jgi:hypothetical protein
MIADFDMTFQPNPRIVSLVRRFVMSLYERLLARDDLAAQIALATHELLENAVKYNVDDAALLRVSLTRSARDESMFALTVRTRNRATQEDILVAQRLIERVRGAPDPMLLYYELIQASLPEPEVSGLGLARIRAETEMSVDVHVDGDQIEVVARIERDLGGGL